MADEKDNVLFGAEFEGQSFAKGVDDIVTKLQQAQAAEEALKKEIGEVNDLIKEQTKAEADLQKQLEKTSRAGKEGQLAFQQTTKELELVRTSTSQLKGDLVTLNKQYTTSKTAVKEYGKVVKEHEKHNNLLSNSLKKATDVNHLAAHAVTTLGGQVAHLGTALIGGLAGGVTAIVIPALVHFVESMFDASEETKKLEKNKKTLNEVFTNAAKAVGDDVAKLEIYKLKLNDTNIPAAERIKIAKEYNKTADETNKIDLKQIDNLKLINEQIEKQNALIIKRAISTAALAKLTEASTNFVDAQIKLDQALKDAGFTEADVQKKVAAQAIQDRDAATQSLNTQGRAVQLNADINRKAAGTNAIAATKEVVALYGLISARDQNKRSMEEMARLLNPLITPDGLTTNTKGPKGPQAPENVYLEQLAALRERLAKATAKEFQSEGLIRKSFEAQLEKDLSAIAKFLRDKKLTGEQAANLNAILKQINDIELTAGLEAFRKKQEEVLRKIDDQLISLSIENATKRVGNLKDEFEREQALIDENERVALDNVRKRQEDFNRVIDEETKKGLVSPEIAKRRKFIGALLFGNLLDETALAADEQRAELAFKKFQQVLEEATRGTQEAGLVNNEETTQAIRALTATYLEGSISYEKFQKEMTKILKEESMERNKIVLEEAKTQLRLIDEQLAKTTDPAQQKKLQAQRSSARKAVDAAQRAVLDDAAGDAPQPWIDQFLDYLKAVQDLANAVVGFWQQVNDAEAKSLERSIALQNKRVENARGIADKGNAEYLEMEQKRLDELERKRENNARKQMAINNALVASQALVAAISAIAQATQTGSPLAAIAAVAAVIGAIGAAYSFVNSLQPQEAAFNEGSEYVDHPGAKPGKDTIRARLTKGERVVTKDDNQKYWETLTAIHNHQIPPDVINDFVANYPNHNVPVVDYDRLSAATAGKMGHDSAELLNEVQRLNGNMINMVDGLGRLGINVKLDENGLEASFTRIQKIKRLKQRS